LLSLRGFYFIILLVFFEFGRSRVDRERDDSLIRFIICMLFVIVFLIVTIPVLFVLWIIGMFNPDLKFRVYQRMAQWALRVIGSLSGARVTVIGEEKIPRDTPVLYVGNHRSFFDIILSYPHCPGPTGFIVKKEMEKIPLLNIWIRNVHSLFLDRTDIKQGLKTILAGIAQIKSGTSMYIFPEGTRNKTDGPILPFHGGSFKLAEKSRCPIVLVAATNSAAIWEDHMPRVRRANVILEYSDPIYLDQLPEEDRRHIDNYCHDLLQEMTDRNRSLV